MTQSLDHEPVEHGSHNIFADLGFPNPEEHLAKAQLVVHINGIIKKRKLKPVEASHILEIEPDEVSTLMCGRVKNFSINQLYHFLNLLGKDVDILVKDKPKTRPYGETHIRGPL